MAFKEALSWLRDGERRQELFLAIQQPVTADQLSRRKSVSLDSSSSALRDLLHAGLLDCLNNESRTSRLYWLTASGERCHRKLMKERGRPRIDYELPDVDWRLYGWTCYRHRSAVLKALQFSLQPATIKRVAVKQDQNLRMSANNVRDIIREFEARGIVRRVFLRKKKHPLYELTEIGKSLRTLHMKADTL